MLYSTQLKLKFELSLAIKSHLRPHSKHFQVVFTSEKCFYPPKSFTMHKSFSREVIGHLNQCFSDGKMKGPAITFCFQSGKVRALLVHFFSLSWMASARLKPLLTRISVYSDGQHIYQQVLYHHMKLMRAKTYENMMEGNQNICL